MTEIGRILEISKILSQKVINEKIFNKRSGKKLNEEIVSLSGESEKFRIVTQDYGKRKKVYSKLNIIRKFNEEKAWKKVYSNIEKPADNKAPKSRLSGMFRYIAYATVAASVFLLIFLYIGDISSRWKSTVSQSQKLIVPDPGKSMVVTNKGNILFLDSSNVSIDISAVIKTTDINRIEEYDFCLLPRENSILVPYGTTCSIKLSDGTQIRLNSGSLLRFPTEFKGETREVTLIGEAYFDVVQDMQKPFIVKTPKFSVKVLGTSFNISCYNDEKSAKISLERGSVKVFNLNGVEYATLQPDQQMSLDQEGRVSILTVNTPMVTAWKEGVFIFDNESIEEIVKKLEKFYNINVVIKDEEIKSLRYFAYFKRYQNPTDVFDILRMTKEIDYSVENNVLKIFSYEK